MERLTIRNSDGSVSQPTKTTFEAAMYRLAAYEDTGLEPEEIDLTQEAKEAIKSLGYKRLAKIFAAEKDGRLVVLPCKVGDTVYRAFSPKGREPVIVPTEIRTLGQAADLVGRVGKRGWMMNVYLTRQEAEEALRKEDNNA